MDDIDLIEQQDLQIITSLIKAMVSEPDDVLIKRSTDEQGVFMRVWVNKIDMSILIGRAGENAKALRQIMRAIGYRNKSHISLKIEEPERV